jgi:hypothetical protein
VDTFHVPQKAKHLAAVVELSKTAMTERQIAKTLGITQPAVQHAKRLAKIMQARRLSDPYVRITQVPKDGKSAFRRHLHPRYRFEPLDGYGAA